MILSAEMTIGDKLAERSSVINQPKNKRSGLQFARLLWAKPAPCPLNCMAFKEDQTKDCIGFHQLISIWALSLLFILISGDCLYVIICSLLMLLCDNGDILWMGKLGPVCVVCFDRFHWYGRVRSQLGELAMSVLLGVTANHNRQRWVRH